MVLLPIVWKEEASLTLFFLVSKRLSKIEKEKHTIKKLALCTSEELASLYALGFVHQALFNMDQNFIKVIRS